MSIRFHVRYVKPNKRTRTGWSVARSDYVDTREQAIDLASVLAYSFDPKHFTIVSEESYEPDRQ